LVGVSLAVIRPAELLVVDAASFAASAMLVAGVARALHDPERQRSRLTGRALASEIAAGLRFLRRHAAVRTMTIISALQSVAGGGFVALMVVWCARVLAVGTSGWRFGLVYAAWSVGALGAAIALPRLLRQASPAAVTLWALPCSAALGVGTALARWWPLAVLGLLSWSVAYTLIVINAVSYRQQVTPEHLLSRVNTAGRMIAWGLGWTCGALLGGVLGQLLGVRPAMTLMASLALPAAVLAWRSPLRSALRPGRGDPSGEPQLAEPDAGLDRPLTSEPVSG
jgi:hypothetical protein